MKTKLFTSLVAFICAVVCAFSFAACGFGTNNGGNNGNGGNGDNGGNTDITDKTVAVTEVALNKSSLTLEIGGEETLTATVKPDNATNKTVSWKSSADGVATVANGKVTAVAEGTAVITASAGGKSGTCEVTVNSKADEEPDPDTPDPEIPEKYTVTFQPNGGTFEDGGSEYSVEVNEGEKVSSVTVTREINYQFLGWFADEEHTELWNFNTKITKSITLYAGWKYVNPYAEIAKTCKVLVENKGRTDVEILGIYESEGYLSFMAKANTGYYNYTTDVTIGTTVESAKEVNIAELAESDIYSGTASFLAYMRGLYNSDGTEEEQQLVSDILSKLLGEGYNIIWGSLASAKGFESSNPAGRIGRYTYFSVNALVEKDGEIYEYSTDVHVMKDKNEDYTPYECVLNGSYDTRFADWSADYKIKCAYYTRFSKGHYSGWGADFDGQPYALNNLGEVAKLYYEEFRKEQEANQNTADPV